MAFQPTTEQYRALNELRGSVHFNTILAALAEDAVATLSSATDPTLMYRAQGSLDTIKTLQKFMRVAPELLAKQR